MHDAIFHQVNQQLNAEIHWMPLAHAGTSNWLYRGSNHEQVLILRINGHPLLSFGVDRQREACVLQAVNNCAWAVRTVLNQAQHGWCVMEHQGLSLSSSAMTAEIRKKLLMAVSGMQQQVRPKSAVALMNYADLFSGYQVRLNEIKAGLPALQQLLRLINLYRALPPVPSTLVHHDLHPGNICWRNGRLSLIDWEYAGWGNPWFDLAALYQYCGLTLNELHQLPAFRHLNDSLLETGAHQAYEMLSLLEQLWYRVRC